MRFLKLQANAFEPFWRISLDIPVLPDHLLDQFVSDDVPLLDLTTHVLGIGTSAGIMTFAARDTMVVACCEEAARMISRCGADVELKAFSGERLEKGDLILRAKGAASALLRAWKMSQNLIEISAGIATATNAIVLAGRSENPGVAITCTRKNVPGTKLISVKAILAGGAMPHRLGLSETILIFAEHRTFLAGISEKETIAKVRRDAAEKKIVVEVATLFEAMAWANAGADVIQAEKFPVEEIAALRSAVEGLTLRPLIAAAGGVNAGNAASYAKAGADILVTSSPYWAKPLDVAVHIKAA